MHVTSKKLVMEASANAAPGKPVMVKQQEVIVMPITVNANVQKMWMPVQKVQNVKTEFAVRIKSCLKCVLEVLNLY